MGIKKGDCLVAWLKMPNHRGDSYLFGVVERIITVNGTPSTALIGWIKYITYSEFDIVDGELYIPPNYRYINIASIDMVSVDSDELERISLLL